VNISLPAGSSPWGWPGPQLCPQTGRTLHGFFHLAAPLHCPQPHKGLHTNDQVERSSVRTGWASRLPLLEGTHPLGLGHVVLRSCAHANSATTSAPLTNQENTIIVILIVNQDNVVRKGDWLSGHLHSSLPAQAPCLHWASCINEGTP
jgi:hypothetical protein